MCTARAAYTARPHAHALRHGAWRHIGRQAAGMSSNVRYARYQARVDVRRWLRSQARPCWICGMPIDYGAPQGTPLCFECDELVPVSRNGSPWDKANVDAAHRCCNNWRRAKGVSEVEAVRKAVTERFGGWSSPLDFVAKAKALRGPRRAGAIASIDRMAAPPKVTTDWL